MRLGVYSDLRYKRTGDVVSTDNAFARFIVGLAERNGGLTVFGRVDDQPRTGAVVMPPALIHFVTLPGYSSLHDWRSVAGAMTQSVRVFDEALANLDAVWLFGPHPLALAMALRARRRRVKVILGIRQHLPAYIRGRFHGPGAAAAFVSAQVLEGAFRRLARRSPTVVVGEDLGRRWRRAAADLLETTFSLVSREDLVPEPPSQGRPWSDPVRVLSVGRLDPEKNPLLLARLLAELGPGWRLTVAGDGTLREELERMAAALGVADRLDLLGNVAFGEALRRRYREADCFAHVSHTEAVPQVLYEAMAAGLPIVATDVGGVAAALGHGKSGLLVPPNDLPRLASALRRLAADEGLRCALARSGWTEASRQTMELQVEVILAFFEATASPGRR